MDKDTFYPNEVSEKVRDALHIADKLVGNGYFAFTFSSSSSEPQNYIFHHYRPTPHAFLDAKMVGRGDVQTCLQALHDYTENFLSQKEEASP
jgi:hypothetical protein